MVNSKHKHCPALSATRLLLILLLSLLLTLPVLAEGEEEDIPMGDGEVTVVIEIPGETPVTVETGEVDELPEQSIFDASSELQILVNEALYEAALDGEPEAEIRLTDESYKIGTLLLHNCEGDIETITLIGAEDGGTRINGNIEIRDVVVQLINIILGGDKILEVNNTEEGDGVNAAVSGGVVAENERLKVLITVPDSAEAEEYSASAVELEASPGSEVVAELNAGSLTVTDTDGNSQKNSVTIEKKNAVSFKYQSTYAPTVEVKGKGGGVLDVNTVNIMGAAAESARFVVESAVVNIRGAMQVKDLKVIAASEYRHLWSPDMGILEDIPGVGGYVKDIQVSNVIDNAMVNILADITSGESITVYSNITQEGRLASSEDFDTGVTVKIGSAEVNVAKGVKLKAGGDVTLKATTRAQTGFDEYGQEGVAFFPISLNVFVDRTRVTLADGVTIEASGSIAADALSSIHASASCRMGLAPVSLAVNVIINQAEAALGKSVTLNAGGNVSVLSTADTVASAVAERAGSATGINGAYLAVNVIIQNSDATVSESDNITAKGNITVASRSDVTATDDAVAAPPTETDYSESGSGVGSTLKSVLNKSLQTVMDTVTGSELFKKLMEYPKAPFSKFGAWIKPKLKATYNLLDSTNYVATLDKDAQEKGSVKVSTDSESVKIKVDSKYVVERVLVRYILSSAQVGKPDTNYTFATATYDQESDCYILKFSEVNTNGKVLTLPEFKVYVFYGDDMKPEVELDDLSKDDDDDEFNLADFFDSALAAAAEENDADEECAGNIMLDYKYLYDGKADDDKGVVVTDTVNCKVTKQISSASALTGVAAGKNVLLNVNPVKGYKAKTMTMTYTGASGEEKTVEIKQNAAGHFIMEVPADAEGAITVTTEFEDEKEPKAAKPSENQYTGSLGVGVVINHNNAEINAGDGQIFADGNVTLSADGSVNIVNLADGTAVAEDDLKKTRTSTLIPTAATMRTADFECEADKTKLYVVGEMADKEKVSITRSGNVYTITVNAAADLGYSLPESITLKLVTEDNRLHAIPVSGKDGVYTVDISKLNLEKNEVSETVTGVPVTHKIQFNVQMSIKSYKLEAQVQKVLDPITQTQVTKGSIVVDHSKICGKEVIKITALPQDGYEAKDIVLTFTTEQGTSALLATRNSDGTYSLQIPDAKELAKAKDGKFTISASFVKKSGDPDPTFKTNLDLRSSSFISDIKDLKKGETGKVEMKDSYKKSYHLHLENLVLKYTNDKDEEKTIKLDTQTGSFTMPSDIKENGTVELSVKDDTPVVTEMKIAVEATSDLKWGKITPQTNTTAGGTTLFVKVEADKDYVITAGTVRASYEGGVSANVKGRLVDNNLYAFDMPASIGNSTGKVTVFAEFKEGDSQSMSLGVAVAANVVVYRNNALLRSGTVSAGKELSVKANTKGKAEVTAKAGYNSTPKAIAGAVAVEVAGYKTNAIIYKDAVIAEETLKVTAKSTISSLSTTADASGKKTSTAGVDGVGVGVAVAVNGIDTKATVKDGVIDAAGTGLKSISVTADNTTTADSVTSKAGAKTKKTGVAPAVALNISGSTAESYLGKAFSNGSERDYSAAAVDVKASGSVAHSMTMDASASSSNKKDASTILAGAFGINILNDVTEAILNGGISAKDALVTVEATSVSTLSSEVKASASGAPAGKKPADKGKGSADTKADAIVKNGEKLSAANGTKSTDPSTVNSLTKDRQTAQTSEGSIAGAAAFALNIQNTTTKATVRDGVNIQGLGGEKAAGVTVSTGNQTSAEIKADGSAVFKAAKGDNIDETGVGVAVAINIVNADNIASLGAGVTMAKDVKVIAGLNKDSESSENVPSKLKTTAISGAGANSVSVAGSVALAVLNTTTEAKIAKNQNDVFSAENTTVMAENSFTNETTATAAANADGSPDVNESARQEQKAADADKDKSVGVGASFAMVYGDNRVSATVLLPAEATVGNLRISGLADHSETSTSVSGRDPWKDAFGDDYNVRGKATDISVDASVAVNAIETVVEAVAYAGASYVPAVNAKTVRISAKEKGKSSTSASGFAMGDETAVGAAIAINLNTATVEGRSECVLKVSGDDEGDDEDPDQCKSVDIYAGSEVTEENNAYATAIGSDMLRYVEKFKDELNAIGKKAKEIDQMLENFQKDIEAFTKFMNSLLDGSLFDAIQKQIESTASSYVRNKVQDKVNSLLDLKKTDDSKKTGSFLPLSANILRVFGAGTPSSEEVDEKTKKANKESNSAINGSDPKSDKSVAEALKEGGAKGDVKTTETAENATMDKDAESFQLAAAVAVSVSSHKALAETTAAVTTAGGASIRAESKVDAIAHATGAALSANGGIGSIAMAVAVKVDSNETVARAGADITVGQGKNIVISADLQENTADTYKDKLALQAVAGAASGSAKVAISGAVAVFVSNDQTIAELSDNAKLMAASELYAGDVSITATETARQTMRTLAAAASSANLTLGASVGVLVSKNTLRARAGENAKIKAKTIRVKAERRSVATEADSGELEVAEDDDAAATYGNEESAKKDDTKTITGVSVTGLLKDTGLFTIKTEEATLNTPKTVKISLDTDMLRTKLETAMNSLANVDYYIAVDSGAVGVNGKSSNGMAAIAGSIAVVVINNSVESIVDTGAVLDSGEDISIEADSAAQSRIISGAATVNTNSKSKAAVGAVVAFVKESNVISAIVEDNAQILSGRDLTIHAANTGLTELYTVTATLAAGGSEEAAVAATINVLLSDAVVSVKLGKGMEHKAVRKALAEAINSKSLTLVTVSPAVGGAKVQVGGAVAVIVEESKALADCSGAKLSVGGEPNATAETVIAIHADNTHNMTIATSSASVGRSNVAVAGVLSVIIDDSAAKVLADAAAFRSAMTDSGSAERYLGGDVEISAVNNSKLLQANVQCTIGSSEVSVGASILVSVLRRTVETDVTGSEILVGNGNLSVSADGTDTQSIIGAGAGITSGVAVQGNIVVVVENNNVSLKASGLKASAVRGNESVARNDVSFSSTYLSKVYGIAGTLTIGGGSAAVGGTVVVLVNNSTTEIDLDSAEIHSAAAVNTTAKADNTLLLVAVGAGVSGGAGVQASLVTAVTSDTVRVNLGKASIYAYVLNINAEGKSKENLVAGSVSVAANAAITPAVVVFVKNRAVEILSEEGGTMGNPEDSCAIAAKALADDNTSSLIIAGGVSGSVSVQAGVCVEIVKNKVVCDFDAEAFAGRQNLDFSADSDSKLTSYAFGGGFSGTAAVVPVITVVYQKSETLCTVNGDTHGYHLDINADSSLKLKAVAAGAAVAGTAGISGTFVITVNEAVTKAIFTASHDGFQDYSHVNVLANDFFDYDTTLITIAGGGVAAVGVTAAVAVMKNTVHAAIDPAALGKAVSEKSVIVAKNVSVAAESLRDVENITGTVGIGGTAGVALNVDVLVAGSALPQDAYDSIVYGNGSENAKTFDSEALVANLNSTNSFLSNHNTLDDMTLTADISGNGVSDSKISVGDKFGVNAEDIIPGEISNDNDDYTGTDSESLKENDTLRGEESDIEPAEGSELSKGASLDTKVNYSYNDAIENVIEAWVDNVIITTDTLDILAHDTQNLEMDSVAVALGGTAGAGVGVTVVVLHSNVLALVGENAEVNVRTLNVSALSDTEDDGISVQGGVIGAGVFGGGAVTVAVAHLDNVTAARVDGAVNKNDSLSGQAKATILSGSDYGKVDASTVSGAASVGVTVGASAAVVTLNGTVSALLNGTMTDVDEIEIYTTFANSVSAEAAAIAMGLGSVNASVAVASETATIRAAVEKNAAISGAKELRVMNVGAYNPTDRSTSAGKINVNAETVNLGVSLVQLNASVSVSLLKLTVDALIEGTVDQADKYLAVRVQNQLDTEAKSDVDSTSAAGAKLGGNVVLSYNDSTASALVKGNVTAGSMVIVSKLTANASATMQDITVSLGALGVSVAYAELKAHNTAGITENGSVKLNSLSIFVGGIETTDKAGSDFLATASMVSGGLSGVSVGVNLAMALNKAVNEALLTTKGSVVVKNLTMKAFGNPSAQSSVNSLALALASAQGSAAVSNLDFTQKVVVDCADLTAPGGDPNVTLGSYLYALPEKSKLGPEDAQSSAHLDINGGSLVSVSAYVAYAKNQTKSLVNLKLTKPVASVVTDNEGGANALAEMKNASYEAVAAGAVVSLSYVTAQFENSVECGSITGDTVSMNTKAVSDAVSKAESNQNGLTLGEITVNRILAKSTTDAKTILAGKDNATVSAKEITVKNDVESHVHTILDKPTSTVTGISIGGNTVESILRTTAAAEMFGFVLNGSPVINVSSDLNTDPNRRIDSDADVLARYLGCACGTSFSVVSGKINVIISKNYSENSADVKNISGGSKADTTVSANSHATALADGGSKAGSDGFSASLYSAGTVIAVATNESKNNATVDNYTADSAKLDVRADMTAANARSVGGVSYAGCASGVSFDTNYSGAFNEATNEAVVKNCGTSDAYVNVTNLSVNSSAEEVYADAYVGTAEVSVNAVAVCSSLADAQNGFNGKSSVENSFFRGDGTMSVTSAENSLQPYDTEDNYTTRASVGASGSATTNIALVNALANRANAVSNATSAAEVDGSALDGYALSIKATGRSDAEAVALTGSKIALLGVTVLKTDAQANGKVDAKLNLSDTPSTLKSLDMVADGAAVDYSETSSAGSVVSLASGNENYAHASTEMEVSTSLTGGDLTVNGNASVRSIGTAIVDAEAKTPNFTLSVANVAVNVTEAESDLKLSTEVTPENLKVGGTLTVGTRVPGANENRETKPGYQTVKYDESKTSASVQPAGGADAESTKITLVGGDVHKAIADSKHDLNLRLGKDGSSVEAGKLLVNSTGNGSVSATSDNGGKVVGVATIGNLYAESTASDSTVVKLGGNITVVNDMDVQSRNDSSSAEANGTAPGKLTAVNASESEVKANIKTNVAGIEVDADSSIETTKGGINLTSYNAGHGTTKMNNTEPTKSLVSISKSSVPVTEEYNTYINIGNNVNAKAATNMNLVTESAASADSSVDQSIAGLGYNQGTMYGDSKATDNSSINIGDNANLTADSGNLALALLQTGDLFSFTNYLSGYALVGEGDIKSEAEYTGNNSVNVGSNASLNAEKGNLSVVQDSSGVKLESKATTAGSASFGHSKVNSDSTMNSNQSLNLGDGASLNSGANLVARQNSGTDNKSTASVNANGGLISFSGGYAKANSELNSNADMDLSKGSITAKNAELTQKTSKLSLNPTTDVNVKVKGFDLDIDSNPTATANLNHSVALGPTDTVDVSGNRSYVSSANGNGRSTITGRSTGDNDGNHDGTMTINATQKKMDMIVENRFVPSLYKLSSDRVSFSGGGDNTFKENYNPDSFVNEPVPNQTAENKRTPEEILNDLMQRLEDEGLLTRDSGDKLSDTMDVILRSGIADQILPDTVAAVYLNNLSAEWLRKYLDDQGNLLVLRISNPRDLSRLGENAIVLNLVGVTEEDGLLIYHFSGETEDGTVNYYLCLNSEKDVVSLYGLTEDGEKTPASAIFSISASGNVLMIYDEDSVPQGIWIVVTDGNEIKSVDISNKK